MSWSEFTGTDYFYRDTGRLRIDNIPSRSWLYRKQVVGVNLLFADGTGREYDPYIIKTEEHLRNINKYLSLEHNKVYFELANDITLSADWGGIGTQTGAISNNMTFPGVFCGTLDGKGYTIKNMKINHKGKEKDYNFFGFFAYLGGTVKNLNLSGTINVELAEEPAYGTHVFVGGIAGGIAAYVGIIDNCHTDVTINVTGPNYNIAGGIAGGIRSTGIINNCSSSGKITVSTSSVKDGIHAAGGGIIGMMMRDGSPKISDSCSNASVTASSGYYSFAGGICGIGLRGSVIERCFASGTIKAQDARMQNNAGGIVGQIENAAYVRECGAAANISASGNPGYFNAVGGLIGSAYENVSIADCYSAGTASVTGPASIGGLVGRAECSIVNSYTTTKITAPQSLSAFEINGLVGTVRSFIFIKECGALNVADPHFVSYDSANNDFAISTSRYSGWDFNQVWINKSSGNQSYPILRNVPEALQKI